MWSASKYMIETQSVNYVNMFEHRWKSESDFCVRTVALANQQNLTTSSHKPEGTGCISLLLSHNNVVRRKQPKESN